MATRYFIRLDDACHKMDLKKWRRIEEIFDKNDIKPIVGVIPNVKDKDFEKYEFNENFVDLVKEWEKKGWHIAMHGYEHVLFENSGGINPVNNKTEFSGLSYEKQLDKIKKSYDFFKQNNINVSIFFAPAHTFDENTLRAIKKATEIRIISDTIANDIYYEDDFYFLPQQSGRVRNIPLNVVTFCYHPNLMDDKSFCKLEYFIKKNKRKFSKDIVLKKRRRNIIDLLLKKTYFFIRKVRNN